MAWFAAAPLVVAISSISSIWRTSAQWLDGLSAGMATPCHGEAAMEAAFQERKRSASAAAAPAEDGGQGADHGWKVQYPYSCLFWSTL